MEESLENLQSASMLHRQSKSPQAEKAQEPSPSIQPAAEEPVYKPNNKRSVSVACKRLTSHMKVINIDYEGTDRPQSSETRFKYVLNLPPKASVSRQSRTNALAGGDMTRARSRCYSTGYKLGETPSATEAYDKVVRCLLVILAVVILAGLFFVFWTKGMNGLLGLTSFTKPLIQPKRELTRWEKLVKFGRNLSKVFQNLVKHLFS
jgi:hypothetical protein